MYEFGEPQHVVQSWVASLPFMQQTVLLSAIRGPDGLHKEHAAKNLLRWFRRCILLDAVTRSVLKTHDEPGGGGFCGPVEDDLEDVLSRYIAALDGVPHHFQLHLLHAAEILGYLHPDLGIRKWWHGAYVRLVEDIHLNPESEIDMHKRLWV